MRYTDFAHLLETAPAKRRGAAPEFEPFAAWHFRRSFWVYQGCALTTVVIGAACVYPASMNGVVKRVRQHAFWHGISQLALAVPVLAFRQLAVHADDQVRARRLASAAVAVAFVAGGLVDLFDGPQLTSSHSVAYDVVAWNTLTIVEIMLISSLGMLLWQQQLLLGLSRGPMMCYVLQAAARVEDGPCSVNARAAQGYLPVHLISSLAVVGLLDREARALHAALARDAAASDAEPLAARGEPVNFATWQFQRSLGVHQGATFGAAVMLLAEALREGDFPLSDVATLLVLLMLMGCRQGAHSMADKVRARRIGFCGFAACCIVGCTVDALLAFKLVPLPFAPRPSTRESDADGYLAARDTVSASIPLFMIACVATSTWGMRFWQQLLIMAPIWIWTAPKGISSSAFGHLVALDGSCASSLQGANLLVPPGTIASLVVLALLDREARALHAALNEDVGGGGAKQPVAVGQHEKALAGVASACGQPVSACSQHARVHAGRSDPAEVWEDAWGVSPAADLAGHAARDPRLWGVPPETCFDPDDPNAVCRTQ